MNAQHMLNKCSNLVIVIADLLMLHLQLMHFERLVEQFLHARAQLIIVLFEHVHYWCQMVCGLFMTTAKIRFLNINKYLLIIDFMDHYRLIEQTLRYPSEATA